MASRSEANERTIETGIKITFSIADDDKIFPSMLKVNHMNMVHINMFMTF